MKIFYDCEFLEDGRTIDLISIGMVAEDGRELYRVVDDEETITRAVAHDWLLTNVVNHLPVKLDGAEWTWDVEHDDWQHAWPRTSVREDVEAFVRETPDPELWAWYGAYDHVAYAQLFGRMLDLPDGFPMWTNDLRQEVARLGNPSMPEQGEGEHSALADARWVMAAANWLSHPAAADKPTWDGRDTPERRDERALWARDIARMLREKTEVAPELRPGILYAADWLDPVTAQPSGEPVEIVAEDDDTDDDEPATDPPDAGESSGRWQPLGADGRPLSAGSRPETGG